MLDSYWRIPVSERDPFKFRTPYFEEVKVTPSALLGSVKFNFQREHGVTILLILDL